MKPWLVKFRGLRWHYRWMAAGIECTKRYHRRCVLGIHCRLRQVWCNLLPIASGSAATTFNEISAAASIPHPDRCQTVLLVGLDRGTVVTSLKPMMIVRCEGVEDPDILILANVGGTEWRDPLPIDLKVSNWWRQPICWEYKTMQFCERASVARAREACKRKRSSSYTAEERVS